MSNIKKPTPITSWYDEIDQVEYQCVTTNQSETYANALAAERVREALEQAAKTVLDGIDDDSSIAALATRRNAAEEILALITKE